MYLVLVLRENTIYKCTCNGNSYIWKKAGGIREFYFNNPGIIAVKLTADVESEYEYFKRVRKAFNVLWSHTNSPMDLDLRIECNKSFNRIFKLVENYS